MSDKTNKGFRTLNWIGVVLLLLTFVFILASLSSSRKLRESQTQLRDSGRPLTLEEIFPERIPDEENAAIELATAVGQLKKEEIGESDLFSELRDAAKELLEDSADADALDRFRRLYASGAVAEALTLVEEGILKDGYHNELDLSQGIMLKLPHIEELMGLSRILAATAQLQAADGDQAGAWDTALTSLRLANALKDEPLLISQLVRTASINRAIDSIRSLDYSAAPRSHLAEIDALLTRMEDPAPFVTALDTERLLIGEQFFGPDGAKRAQLTDTSQRGLGHNIVMGAYQFLPPLRQRDRAEHSNALREMADMMSQPFAPGDLQLAKKIHADIPLYSVISKMTVPALGTLKSRMTTTFAEASITRAGLAVMDYQDQHGAYPPDLASLGRDDLMDPFNGEPLRYRSDGTGFTIYSVGEDQTDDSAATGSDEITWSYSEPPNAPPESP
jgi:hypothetical protein